MEPSRSSDRHMPMLGDELTLFRAMTEMYINSGNESVSQLSRYAVCNRKIAAREPAMIVRWQETWHINRCQQYRHSAPSTRLALLIILESELEYDSLNSDSS